MQKNLIHYSRHGMKKHKVSPLTHFVINIITPIAIAFVVVIIGFGANTKSSSPVDISMIFKALGASFFRLIIAYIISLIIALALAIWSTSSRRAESILLPLFDVLESVPVLVFFPVIIIFFVNYNFFNAAAIFILVLTMIWNIVFSVIGGMRLIPEDIKVVSHVFSLSKCGRFWKVILPAVMPSIITGSLLAWAAGWNILIVAEVLGNYVPQSSGAANLFGIGSLLVNASTSSENTLFIGAVIVIVISVVVLNIFVWQPLLRFSERYTFDS